jgi:CubicO group peptidase (beta-lactamase class C family)
VSQRWVDVSTRPHIDVPDGSADGYGWHIQPIQAHGRTWRMYYASGNGGQLVMVVPDLDLVVAFTAGNFNRYPIWRTFRDELLPSYILRAATTGH